MKFYMEHQETIIFPIFSDTDFGNSWGIEKLAGIGIL